MKFDGEIEIGGLETGPVLFRTRGGPRCQDYFYSGRKLLGELKQGMQLGEIGFGKKDVIFKNGVRLHAQSNRIGLADMDEVWIDVTGMVPQDKKMKCLGFILVSYWTPDELYRSTAYFKIKHPSDGRILDSVEDFDYHYNPETGFYDYETYVGFPDNNAKYFDAIVYNADTGDAELSNFQSVVVAKTIVDDTYIFSEAYTMRKYRDDYGVSNYTGFNPGEYIFYRNDEGFGNATFIMIPSDDSWKFRHSDLIKNNFYSGLFQGVVQDSIGLPITVPEGDYLIDIMGLSHKLEINLLVEEDGAKRFIKQEKTHVAETNGNELYTYAYSIKIKVGEFTDAKNIVNFSDVSVIT